MPSLRYINQSAPFWDFVASLEDQGAEHPFFSAYAGAGDRGGASMFGIPGAAHLMGGRRHGRPAPPYEEGQSPATEAGNPPSPPIYDVYDDGPAVPPSGDGPSSPHPPPPPTHSPDRKSRSPSPGHRHGHRGGSHHRGAAHSPGDRPRSASPGHYRGAHHRGRGGRCGGPHGPWGGRRGPWARHGWGNPTDGAFNMGALAEFFQSQLFGGNDTANEGGAARGAATSNNNNKDEFFSPPVDVFDTDSAYHIHVSLPGARKEDIGVHWDAEKSELSVAGVVYRPGDEDFLKTLALDERKVGTFERKVRLGSRANPAQVDEEGIKAKMEDGVLKVEVPKEDRDYVEIRKVDVE